MNRKIRRTILRIARIGAAHKIDRLAERQALAERIKSNAVAGRMVLGVSGTDCDGYRFGPHFSVHTASAMLYEVVRQRNFDGADGPIGTWVCTAPDRETWEGAYDCDRCDLTADAYRSFMGLPWDWQPAH